MRKHFPDSTSLFLSPVHWSSLNTATSVLFFPSRIQEKLLDHLLSHRHFNMMNGPWWLMFPLSNSQSEGLTRVRPPERFLVAFLILSRRYQISSGFFKIGHFCSFFLFSKIYSFFP
jgi:hypothetical protein